MLRSKLASGAYSSFPSAKAFADQVSADLQAVNADAHLRLHIIPPEDRGTQANERPISLPSTSAVTRSGWLAPGVAYVSFSMFPGNEATLKDLRAFLDAHQDAKTLIVDARGHRGGGLDEMDMIFGEVFDQPTELLILDTRTAAEERGVDPASLTIVPTKEDVVRRLHTALPDATPTGLRKADIYYLTSKKTASAGEHMALAFKRTHRATVIGETTRGAGHYGDMVAVGSIYAAFIPVGRTFDPATGEGWETVGVKPDVETTADAALDEALRRAGVGLTGEPALAALR
jgi:C-terminal processing protease CtpA/Prc